ncbi:hypothetical protein TRAPUB_9169 [Trametes pubescens]|uniref:DUF6533 domain-containing protein n=1 Tax=Trametes pubescens TaxID=154538 RepID=A0A1M2W376_TRAPU|nr:hypothetical protein TRAPUB_9169 [Trametes pubescens]
MDYMRTFTREVEHVWKRELSTSAALFYLVRYPGLISTLFVVLEETGWAGISDKYAYAKLDISYTTSPAPGCGVTPDMSDAMYENCMSLTSRARLSAVLTDMVVLGITIWKARTTRVQGVKISVKSTMVYILMRDGVLYFGVLLIANLIGLILARFLVVRSPDLQLMRGSSLTPGTL